MKKQKNRYRSKLSLNKQPSNHKNFGTKDGKRQDQEKIIVLLMALGTVFSVVGLRSYSNTVHKTILFLILFPKLGIDILILYAYI